jgi:hypothetical protein
MMVDEISVKYQLHGIKMRTATTPSVYQTLKVRFHFHFHISQIMDFYSIRVHIQAPRLTVMDSRVKMGAASHSLHVKSLISLYLR